LNYIYVNGGWRGKPISWNPRTPVTENGGYYPESRDASLMDMNDFTRRMESLTLNGVRVEEDKDAEEDVEDVNVDRPWREVE
jgi:helicase MOV-10